MTLSQSISSFLSPMPQFNCLAVFFAAMAGFVFGWLWYGPFFGKTWMKLAGVKEKRIPTKKVFSAMLIAFLVSLLTTYVLAHAIAVWRPSTWSPLVQDMESFHYSFFVGFFAWLGFYVPVTVSSVLWENKPWKLFFLNNSFYFFNLQIMSAVIAFWPN